MGPLPPARKLALRLALPVLRAEEELAAGGVPDGRLYDLVLAATGSEAAAAAALERRYAERLRRGERPG